MRAIIPAALAAAFLLGGCGHGGAGWNDDTGKELKQKLDQMFKDIDAGNFAGLKLWADANPVVFDFDENNNPVEMHGADGLDKYLAAYDATVRKGLKVHTTISKEDCFGDRDIGFCTVEYDQTIGDSGGPFKFRGTLIARQTKDGWRWVHWHGSFREFPKPAAPAVPTEAAPSAEAPAPTDAAPAATPPPAASPAPTEAPPPKP